MRVCFLVLAHVSGGDQSQGLGPDVQARDSEVDRHPDPLLQRPHHVAFLGMEDATLARRLEQFLQALVAAEMEQTGYWHAQQVAQRKPAQPLRRRVGIEELVRVRVEQEERIPRLLK